MDMDCNAARVNLSRSLAGRPPVVGRPEADLEANGSSWPANGDKTKAPYLSRYGAPDATVAVVLGDAVPAGDVECEIDTHGCCSPLGCPGSRSTTQARRKG
ncbi:MAG: hypothetical protein Kow0010_18100 [Dehalococcoidia bacterium]